jgi:hypothetical protein
MPRGRPKKPAEATKQEAEAPKPGQVNGGAISKLEAVRRSLAELGNDAKPLALQGHLKKTFGIDMEPSYISKYKSLVLTSARKLKGSKPKPAVPATPAPTPAPKASATGGGISLDDIRAVKELTARLGADKVSELAGLLAR